MKSYYSDSFDPRGIRKIPPIVEVAAAQQWNVYELLVNE